MSRVLSSVVRDQQQSNPEQNQRFYLQDQLPMFLAQNQTNIKNTQNLDEEIAKCKELIESLCDNQIKTKQSLDEIEQIVDEQEDLSKGMGYFAAKNMLFLEYLMLLKVYELFKLNGRSLISGQGLDLYRRLAYLKTLFLKLQPVEKKLEYQKNKILKNIDRAVVTKQQKKQQSEEEEQQADEEQQAQGKNGKKSKNPKVKAEQQLISEAEQQQDEMAFRPRPNALMKIKQQKDMRVVKNGKYEAPKVSSNLSKQQKLKQRMQRQKQRRKLGLIRRLQSDLIQDDRAEQKYVGDQINERLKKKFHEKTTYQEQAFIRLPDNKKDKYYRKQMIRNSNRKSQLQEDFKQVQLVGKLFENENQVQHKLMGSKKQTETTGKRAHVNKKEEQTERPRKMKKISKR